MAVTGTRLRQYSLSLKVSEEKKNAFAERCAVAGMSQSEMLERCIFGRLPDETPLPAVLRDHLSLVHHLRASLADGAPVHAAALDDLIDATRTLIAEIRGSVA